MLNTAIHQYLISQELRSLVPVSHTRKHYEYLNCIERWVISLHNSSNERDKKKIDQKLLSELKEKRMDQKLFNSIKKVKNNNKKFDVDNIDIQFELTGTYGLLTILFFVSQIKPFKICMKLSLKKFKELQNYENSILIPLVLRYESLINGGQQWSLPEIQFEHLYKKYNVRYEGFASPLNSGLSSKFGTQYYSLFEEDKELGSAGNFFNQKLYNNPIADDLDNLYTNKLDKNMENKHWVINPPFIAPLMEKVSYKIIKEITYASEQHIGVMVVYVMPLWEDFHGYQIIKDSKFTKFSKVLHKKKHFYEHSGNRKIVAMNSIIFVLDSYTDDYDYSDIANPMILQ